MVARTSSSKGKRDSIKEGRMMFVDPLNISNAKKKQMVSPAKGSTLWNFLPYSCPAALVRKLWIEIVNLSGHHVGVNTTHFEELAKRLHNILDGYESKIQQEIL